MVAALKRVVLACYRALLARKSFYWLNRYWFTLILRGMGILNYENDRVTGEERFLCHSLPVFVPVAGGLVVLDVGANEGRYACRVREIYPDAELYAFEPHPETFQRLQLTASKEGFKAFNVACGERSDRLRLYDCAAAQGKGTQFASLYDDVFRLIHCTESSAWDVQVIALDQFIAQWGLQKVHLVKVDTEGHDLSVLLGAAKSIESGIIDIIQFEFNEMNVVSRTFLKDFRDALPGYVFFRMLPDGLAPLGKYNPLTWELFAYQNIVAVPERCLLDQR